jgi:hypothetical protein
VAVDVLNARVNSLKVLALLLPMVLMRHTIHAYLVAYISIIWTELLILPVKRVIIFYLKRKFERTCRHSHSQYLKPSCSIDNDKRERLMLGVVEIRIFEKTTQK